MHDKPTVSSDAILTYVDARTWVFELYRMPTDELKALFIPVEPALTAVTLDLSYRLRRRLLKAGVDEAVATDSAISLMRAGLICGELTRRAFRKFQHTESTFDQGDGQ